MFMEKIFFGIFLDNVTEKEIQGYLIISIFIKYSYKQIISI
jgi:hypothetical protein